jgi:pimeloyl-ACP methyl ester carboxylesterase
MTDKKNQTIILIHGFRGTHEGLDLIAAHLKQFTIIVPDLPGFAKGDTLAHYDLKSYVTWLADYIAKQKLAAPPILLGHSFGSIISAAYAAKHGQAIEKLVLVNPIGAMALEGPRGALTKLAIFYYWVGTKLPDTASRRWLSLPLIVDVMSQTMTKTKNKQLRRYIFDQHRQYFSLFHTPSSLSEAFSTSVSNSVRDFASNIMIPTLLIAGTKDDITPLIKQKELQQLFPNAKLAIIEDVGHLTHYETPDQVASLVEAFVRLS